MADTIGKFGMFEEKLSLVESDENLPSYLQPLLSAIKVIMRDILHEFEILESKVAVNSTVITAIKDDRDSLANDVYKLQIDLEEAQNYSRRNCLLLHGVDEEQGENTDNKIINIIHKETGVELNHADIDRSHRIGRPAISKKPNTRSNKKRARPIIIKFVSYRDRSSVFFNKRYLKGKNISISESLTPTRYSLYKKCKDIFGYKNVWTIDNRIHVSLLDEDGNQFKQIITCEDDINWPPITLNHVDESPGVSQ